MNKITKGIILGVATVLILVTAPVQTKSAPSSAAIVRSL